MRSLCEEVVIWFRLRLFVVVVVAAVVTVVGLIIIGLVFVVLVVRSSVDDLNLVRA